MGLMSIARIASIQAKKPLIRRAALIYSSKKRVASSGKNALLPPVYEMYRGQGKGSAQEFMDFDEQKKGQGELPDELIAIADEYRLTLDLHHIPSATFFALMCYIILHTLESA